MKYRLSDDKFAVDFIKRRLEENEGYCPGVMGSRGKEEFKCPCDDFVYKVEKGETCRCGLSVKVKK